MEENQRPLNYIIQIGMVDWTISQWHRSKCGFIKILIRTYVSLDICQN